MSSSYAWVRYPKKGKRIKVVVRLRCNECGTEKDGNVGESFNPKVTSIITRKCKECGWEVAHTVVPSNKKKSTAG